MLFRSVLLSVIVAGILYTEAEDVHAYARRFGRRLAGERGDAAVILAGKAIRAVAMGVVVTALCPSYTATKMLDNPAQGRKLTVPTWMILDPVAVAQEGIAGCLNGKPLVIPGWSNRIGMGFVQCLPRVWVTRLFGRLYRRGQS